ncbi:nucleotide exchange factor GrpE [Candidatus Annandia pinicola]|uniref:nucleotide exchange factor GrpE n=1 Tax=Candidatus Annandia pinicola TaxID=1345117 RepID=UPI001D02805B|nr:nucleotide exchange factor GrpE [Candidatus Annandia pinicola]UDG80319.1 Protein GrpE [Candidatus Annandia pinicola]
MNNNIEEKNKKKIENEKDNKKKDKKKKKIENENECLKNKNNNQETENTELFLKKKIKKLKKKIILLTSTSNDINLRAKAEVENMRRRNQKEIEKIHKFALEDFMYELLPTIDNLEKSVEIAKNNKINDAIIEGIKLTLKSFLDTISKFGVDIIGNVNDNFDPKLHQAISIQESNEIKNDKIIKVMQKGYSINKRLLRPAMVIVSKFIDKK